MTHLFDTSAHHKYVRNSHVRSVIDAIRSEGVIVTTCPPVVAEYCFSARNTDEMRLFQDDMSLLHSVESLDVTGATKLIQSALWSTGRMRAAGAIDTLSAAYALLTQQVLVTCDVNHVHIARALEQYATRARLRVIYIAETGELTRVAA